MCKTAFFYQQASIKAAAHITENFDEFEENAESYRVPKK